MSKGKKIAGTPQGRLRRLSSNILKGGLLSDLDLLEETGYDDNVCDLVKEVLNEIYEECKPLAQSAWMSEIVLDFGDFEEAYKEWNGQGTKTTEEAKLDRRENVLELKKKVSSWTKIVNDKHFQSDLGTEPDIVEFCDKTVELLQNICDKHKSYFKNLNGTLKAYRLYAN